MRTFLFLAALLFAFTAITDASADPLPDPSVVPGYQGTTPPETGYAHGQMYGDAETRALTGTGSDGKAARTVTDGFIGRPDVPIDERETWADNAKTPEETPGDFVSIMEGAYSDCTGGNVTPGAATQAYTYTCTSPASKSKYACREVLEPVCTNVSSACMTLVATHTGIMPFSFDGSRYMYIGKRARDSIPDHGNPTREHNYVAELQFDVNLKDVNRFILERLEYEDFVEITFNGVPVFTDLDRRQYSKPQTCGGCHIINRPVSRNLNFDLRPYLKEGLNIFRARLNAVAHGNLWLKLDTDSRCCKAWDDQWKETCR
ncbi:hypothetical protein JCM17844_28360 [Iodidimonas gelatinilytica]|uniref:Uncharacterized protein n=1 Tax=Iodidimonas gelatinilytica TaxID=1236966 RepID=A0A5A7MWC3_9PROT|nr:hypothetical protein [Iodidimonas gelatinilytica]GEQ99199.1 hypothetical protein JCM17844_28360 [Iodidimonas gelatinilytica]